MNYRSVKFLSVLGAGASLGYLYLVFAVAFIDNIDPARLNAVELAIVVTLAARLVAVFVLPELRNAKVEVVWILFSVETFLVVGLMGVFLYTSDPFYSRLVVDVFSTWLTTLAVVTPPYTIFRCAVSMVRESKLWGILVSVIAEFGFLVFMNNMVSQIKAPINIRSFLTAVILNVRSDVVGGKNPLVGVSQFAEAAILLYVALIVYAAFPAWHRKVDSAPILVPAVASTMVLFGWISLATGFMPNTYLSLTVPTILLTALVWWFTHGK